MPWNTWKYNVVEVLEDYVSEGLRDIDIFQCNLVYHSLKINTRLDND